jgi:Uma2 family endonuclease
VWALRRRITMTAMPAAQTLTADEFLELPLDMDEYGWAPCLVEGELVVNQPLVDHQELLQRLTFALATWVEAGAGRGFVVGPLDVLIDDRNVYAADLLWYAEGRRPPRGSHAPYAMPDLAVEVRSPSTWRYDIGAKKSGYERKGLPELWLVDTPASEVLVFRRSAPDAPRFDLALELSTTDVLESPLLPNFALSLKALFAEN